MGSPQDNPISSVDKQPTGLVHYTLIAFGAMGWLDGRQSDWWYPGWVWPTSPGRVLLHYDLYYTATNTTGYIGGSKVVHLN